ncbi:hypothetical protein KM043_001684 [Ampulex compressa]|nr:hypothetical protein KM043_001684 [Ampulex compressa]
MIWKLFTMRSRRISVQIYAARYEDARRMERRAAFRRRKTTWRKEAGSKPPEIVIGSRDLRARRGAGEGQRKSQWRSRSRIWMADVAVTRFLRSYTFQRRVGLRISI